MEEEKEHLRPCCPQLELALVTEAKVTPSSLISVDTVFSSVPKYPVGKRVIVKKYHIILQISYFTPPFQIYFGYKKGRSLDLLFDQMIFQYSVVKM